MHILGCVRALEQTETAGNGSSTQRRRASGGRCSTSC
ncbi:hypothetical protein D9619_013448 [Psilocybe cf. subviscida]|uniref:Uncharacterized protein n=1 Tax=Psilocybe cf. subviscida TaxID=2480587 RepID=A0A8H5BRI0_9AGAR|nr:hypothetical protein D9619_013448 [Psilocybe cf. subviscida]